MSMDDTITLPGHLSHSAISTYAECGERWRLERGFKVPSGTWFATCAGSAIHWITEQIDLADWNGIVPENQLDGIPSFQEVFDGEIADQAAAGREVKASGKLLKSFTETGGPNKKDREWYLHWGPIWIERWRAWKAAMGWTLATMPDGTPGIELAFEVEMGGYPIQGKIDRLYVTDEGAVTVFDLKTGEIPTGSLQIMTYALGLRREYGITADWGVFWSPGKKVDGKVSDIGGLSPIVSIGDWNLDRVDAMYAQAKRGIEAGVFLPKVSNMCVGCGVRDYCWAVAGKKSKDFPVDTQVMQFASPAQVV